MHSYDARLTQPVSSNLASSTPDQSCPSPKTLPIDRVYHRRIDDQLKQETAKNWLEMNGDSCRGSTAVWRLHERVLRKLGRQTCNARANLPITASLGSLCKEHDWPSHLWIWRLTQISLSLSLCLSLSLSLSNKHAAKTHVWRLLVPWTCDFVSPGASWATGPP